MPNSPEQVKAFEKQIEGSIDFQIDQLRELDAQKSKDLQFLKSSILNQIKQEREDDPLTPEKEGKYSADLRLTEDELKSVFEDVKTRNAQLFAENGIEHFFEFSSFIGFDSNEISFAHSLQEVTLFGRQIEMALPLGVDDRIAKNFTAALKQIEQRKDFEPFITASTKLIPRGGMRLEFTIQKGGKEVRYSATPERVLRVDQEPPVEQIKEWIQTALNRRNLGRQLRRDSLQGDKSLGDEQRMMIEMMRMRMHKMRDGREEEFKIPEKYQAIIDQIEALYKQERRLAEQCFVRMLFDEANGKIVREEGDPLYTTDFQYEYLAQDGSTETIISHYSNRKESVSEYFPQSEQARKRTTFHDNGAVRDVDEYLTNGEIVSKFRYRKNGTLETKRVGRNEDVYDESGANVVYRRLWPEGTGQVTNVMVARNGENFATLDFMRKNSSEMSNSQYLDYLAKNLDTPQKLHLFFELFMQYVYDSADPTNPLAKGTRDDKGDYWQMAEETVQRIEDGKMLGDCDDYAFLAKEILKKQGKIAYVQSIPSHAICIWFEKNANGRWDAYSMGTFGFDKNGNRYGMPIDQEKEKGYTTLEEALNSLMPKYDNIGIGVSRAINYRIKNGKVEILHVSEKGKQVRTNGVPVDLLPNMQVIDRFVAAQGLMKVGQYAKAISEYEALLREDPSHSDLYHEGLVSVLVEKSFSIPTLLKYAKKYPDRHEYYAVLGKLYRWESQDTKAFQHFRLAIEKGSTDQQLYIDVASHYKVQGQFDEQIKTLELALRKVPSDALNSALYIWLAKAYLETGNKDKAIQTYESALEIDWCVIEPLAYLYYSHQQDLDKAKQLFFRDQPEEIKKNPDTYEYQDHLSKFYGLLLDRSLEETPSRFDAKYQTEDGYNSVRITPEFLRQYPDIALLYSERTKALEKVCKSEQSQIYQVEKLVGLYHHQGKEELALQTLQTAIERFKYDIISYRSLMSEMIELLLVQGNIEKAVQIYSENKELKLSYLGSNMSYIEASQETMMAFYDKLLSTVENSRIYADYLYYLSEHNQAEKLRTVVGEAIKKFPKDKERFEDYLSEKPEK